MSTEKSQKRLGAINIIFGVVIIILAIIVWIFSDLAILTLITIISFALAILGLARIINGGTDKELSNWVKLMKVITGTIFIIVAIVTIILHLTDPTLTIETLILILASALLILGLARFVRGLTAKEVPVWFRAIIIVVGAITTALSIWIMFSLTLENLILIYILAILLVLNGIARITLGLAIFKRFAE